MIIFMSFYQGKTVLVTGAAGFIGSHLTDALLAEGATVIGVDNFITGNKKNLEHLISNERLTFIEADVISPPGLWPLNSSPSLVFHLASPASPLGYQSHPIETYLANSIGTHNLLQYLLKTNPSVRFVYTSTSESYGDPLEHPQKETYWGNVNPNGPRSMYDESKRLGETICGVHRRSFGLDCRIARIFNTYGPRIDIDDGRVIPDFMKSVLANTPLTIHGDGSQTRAFCYVTDLVAGLMRLMEVENISGETINLGNPEEITMRSLAEKISEVAKIPLQLTTVAARTDDPSRRCPDITKAKEILGWEPKVSLDAGLKMTLEYFQTIDKGMTNL
jgi:UDP-glucuronate decarboxylase